MKSLLLFIKAMSSISSMMYVGSVFAPKLKHIAYHVLNPSNLKQLMDEKAPKTERESSSKATTSE